MTPAHQKTGKPPNRANRNTQPQRAAALRTSEAPVASEFPGTLHIVSTPIGNLSDITLRALETLRSVDLIAAEDTRHTRKLLSRFDIHKPLLSYREQNMARSGPRIIERLLCGESVALVTDAGTPGISDPGEVLIRRAIENAAPVTVIPGPSALVTALTASGLSTQPFAFLGFPPARGSKRREFFTSFSRPPVPMTLVLYESPQRLLRTFEDILKYWGSRRVAVARELTKMHEEIFRGTIEQAMEHFSGEVKGEITLVVEGVYAGAANDVNSSGRPGSPTSDDIGAGDWEKELDRLLATPAMTVKDAARQVSARFNLPRRDVYRAALSRKGRS